VDAEHLARFKKKYEEDESGCWVWKGAMSGPTPYFWLNGRAVSAAMASYRHHVGDTPNGSITYHKCRNQRCVRPDHIIPATRSQHSQMIETGISNARKTHCPYGHPYDEANTIRYGGRRYCKTCQNAMSRKRDRRRRGTQKKKAERPDIGIIGLVRKKRPRPI